MIVNAVEAGLKWITVEYDDSDGFIQRRLIPRQIFDLSSGQAEMETVDINKFGVEYSDVDLVTVFGENLPPTSTSDLAEALRLSGLGSIYIRNGQLLGMSTKSLQDKLRRAGFWRISDYRSCPELITETLESLIV